MLLLTVLVGCVVMLGYSVYGLVFKKTYLDVPLWWGFGDLGYVGEKVLGIAVFGSISVVCFVLIYVIDHMQIKFEHL